MRNILTSNHVSKRHVAEKRATLREMRAGKEGKM
jgi:hypothetical protein